MVFVPAAEVALGSPHDFDENPVETARIAPFFIDIHPATNGEYAKFVAATGHRLPKHWLARGSDGREYPWGGEFSPDRCNCRMTGLGGTSPLGSFPDGLSPFGCHDMAGNVWEWTDSWDDESEERRVLRGGSWGSGSMSVRACYRGRDFPTYWSNGYGVRCALSRLR